MRVNNQPQTTLWCESATQTTFIIDQTLLPHQLDIIPLKTLDDFCHSISAMQVRGAPLIGITAAFGLAAAIAVNPQSTAIAQAANTLIATRPTAINLRWAVEKIQASVANVAEAQRADVALQHATRLRQHDIATCEAIGEHGYQLIAEQHRRNPNKTLNILTHCNAGWLATIDWGTALAPIYKAQQAGIPLHVWVDETRPRNQGAKLTAWELGQQGVPHTIIADNTGGHLMQHGLVDLCIVGSDRTTAAGDVCNKIGTYLKALSANDNNVPFYVALPASTIDWTITDGVKDIPIEEREAEEITHMNGVDANGQLHEVLISAPGSAAANYGFDVTPARLVTGLITEHGVYSANQTHLAELQNRVVNAQ